MLKPEEMTRAVVVGSMDSLDATIECLYEQGILHLIDFTTPDVDFKIGQPLSKASADSQKLLKLRSMMRVLGIEEHKPKEKMTVSAIDKRLEQALVTLDLNTTTKNEAKQKIQSLIREKEAEIRALYPFASFGIAIEDYDSYDNVTCLTGICRRDPSDALTSKIREIEIFTEVRKSDVSVAVFVKNELKPEALKILSDREFQEVKLPKLTGDPKKIISANQEQISDLKMDLRRIETDLEKVRKQFADFIISSEEHLSIEVMKEETPLRIAATENTFVMDGWVPRSRFHEIQKTLNQRCGVHVFVEAIATEKDDEPPTRLMNSKLIRPFELFINMGSTPKYKEIDPTVMLFITFPLFFGLMIGDLGFGMALFLAGLAVRLKMKGSQVMKNFGTIVMAGGLMASIFGLFVFAEAFGVPFHPPPLSADEYSWESVAYIPIHPMIEKMENVNELLAISMLAGWAHLTVGLVFGFFNTIHHSLKHAIGKFGWLLMLLGLFEETMVIAGNATITSEFINSTLFFAFPTDFAMDFAGIELSIPALVFIIVGVVVLLATEGGFALTELTGIFTNLISYARLAAIAVGKGGMALAFNTMLFPMMFNGWDTAGEIVISILGAVLLVVAQLFFVFFLGALSAGIQAIRLNYVEFFLKFFEGGGTEFSPLTYERKYSVITTE